MLHSHTATCRSKTTVGLKTLNSTRTLVGVAVSCLLVLAALPAAPARVARAQQQGPPIPSIPAGSAYRVTHLVSDAPGLAPVLDPLLVNPWGLAMTSSGPAWVVNSGTRTAQAFRRVTNPFGFITGGVFLRDESLPTLSLPAEQSAAALFNSTGDFNVTPEGGSPSPAHLIFSIDPAPADDHNRRLAAWQPALGDDAQLVGPSVITNFAYTGLAAGSNSGGNRLYAAEFAEGVDVFDGAFTPTTVAGGFLDPTIPADYFPYNIQNLGGSLYVTYAKRGAGVTGVRNGQGLGLVRKFDTDGVRDPAFAVNDGPASKLNAPYGLAIAPASFGIYGGALLVGNFADRANPVNQSGEGGRINAYNKDTGAYLGTLQSEAGEPLEVDGLRALAFGNGGAGGDADALYFTASIIWETHGLLGKIRPTAESATSLIQFSSAEYVVEEEPRPGHIDITVTRAGSVTNHTMINYATVGDPPGHASQKGDYQLNVGTLFFAPGETSKTFRVLIVDDAFLEGDERITLVLSNPPDEFGVGLGSPSVATLKIIGGDLPQPTFNPSDSPGFFVFQHYLDFLSRKPDTLGITFWTNEIESCGSDAQCREIKRINVSAAFFLSIEFRETGLLAYLAHRAAFGARPLYGDFMRDLLQLQQNVAFGQPGASAQLEANKQLFFRNVTRSTRFVDEYPFDLTPAQFVDALYANAGVTPSAAERDAAIAEFGGSNETSNSTARERVLRRVAENADFARQEFNAAFVTMQYFGYLRRDPDEGGFNFWLAKLNQFDGNFVEAEMVKAFISSIEYRQRFGQP